jgi:hypothetical protein
VPFWCSTRSNNDVRVAEYDKPNGAIVQRMGYFIGEVDGAAGSIMTELVRDEGSDGSCPPAQSGYARNAGRGLYAAIHVGAS